MTPDYDAAATKAYETLIAQNITAAPVDPQPILKRTPGVLLLSFAQMATLMGRDREDVLSAFSENQDAVTCTKLVDGKYQYVVAYNQMLPLYMVQRALARELGHIMLGHDGTRTDEVRTAEAYCFAHHLLCPRPVIKALQDANVRISVEVLGNVTGCYERCLSAIRKEPSVSVLPDLNRQLRDQFESYINNYIAFQKTFARDDDSALADFGCYMEGYEE